MEGRKLVGLLEMVDVFLARFRCLWLETHEKWIRIYWDRMVSALLIGPTLSLLKNLSLLGRDTRFQTCWHEIIINFIVGFRVH